MVFFQDLFSRLFCDPCNIEYECCTDPDTIKERQLRTLRRPRPHRHLGTSSLTTPEHLLVSGYLRALQRSCHSLHNRAHLGISVIAHLSTSYYLSNALRAHHHIYLLSEPCKDAQLFPALDDSADDIDDDEIFPTNSFVDTETRMPGELDVNEHSTSGAVYFSDIRDAQRTNSNGTPRYGHLELFELDGSPPTDSMIVKFAAMTAVQDVPLPPPIHSQLVHRYREQQSEIGEHEQILKEYSVCFKLCGSSKHGWSDSCSAVIVDETHGPRLDGSCAFRWRLPRFPHKTGGNGVTFSAEHGLLSVGGYKSAKCHALSFSSPAFFDQSQWKWRELPSMSAVRWFPSTAMMGDRLCAMAGSSANHEPLASVELFDFEREDWRSLSACSNARKYGGLRQIGDRMVLGGGDHATQSVESYDATKNVWQCLPNTRLPHRYYPNLWGAEDKGGKEIYISCSYSNSIEALDVRARDGWRVVCDGKLFENRITALQSLDYSQFRALR